MWFPSRHLLVQSQQLKHQNNAWKTFRINNKGNKTTWTYLTSFCQLFYCRLWTNITNYYQKQKELTRCSVKSVFENFAKFTGKHLCLRLFNKIAGLPATSLKRWTWHRCFPVNFAKILNSFFAEYLWWLLLQKKALVKISYTALNASEKLWRLLLRLHKIFRGFTKWDIFEASQILNQTFLPVETFHWLGPTRLKKKSTYQR